MTKWPPILVGAAVLPLTIYVPRRSPAAVTSILAMDPNSQLPRNGGISSLNAAIEDMSQARDNSGGVPPVKAVFGSVIVVLTMIRVCFLLMPLINCS